MKLWSTRLRLILDQDAALIANPDCWSSEVVLDENFISSAFPFFWSINTELSWGLHFWLWPSNLIWILASHLGLGYPESKYRIG